MKAQTQVHRVSCSFVIFWYFKRAENEYAIQIYMSFCVCFRGIAPNHIIETPKQNRCTYDCTPNFRYATRHPRLLKHSATVQKHVNIACLLIGRYSVPKDVILFAEAPCQTRIHLGSVERFQTTSPSDKGTSTHPDWPGPTCKKNRLSCGKFRASLGFLACKGLIFILTYSKFYAHGLQGMDSDMAFGQHAHSGHGIRK